MKKIIISLSLLSFILLSIIGCEDYSELTAPTVNLGSANFSRFVSIGNSLTMGEQSSSVFEGVTLSSFHEPSIVMIKHYPNLLTVKFYR